MQRLHVRSCRGACCAAAATPCAAAAADMSPAPAAAAAAAAGGLNTWCLTCIDDAALYEPAKRGMGCWRGPQSKGFISWTCFSPDCTAKNDQDAVTAAIEHATNAHQVASAPLSQASISASSAEFRREETSSAKREGCLCVHRHAACNLDSVEERQECRSRLEQQARSHWR